LNPLQNCVDFFKLLSNTDLLPGGCGGWNIVSLGLFCVVVGVVYAHLRCNNPLGKSRAYHFSIVFLFAWAVQVLANDLIALVMAAIIRQDPSILGWPFSLESIIGIPVVVDIRFLWISFALISLIYCCKMEKGNLTWGLTWAVILVQVIDQIVFLSTGYLIPRAYPSGSDIKAMVFWAFYVPPYLVYALGVLSMWKINVFKRAQTLLSSSIFHLKSK